MTELRARRVDELKIGDLERRTGVSRSTIQHYVRLGLLPPPRKLGPKLFLFDAAHAEALERIRALRADEKLPLASIRERLRSSTRRASEPPPRRDAAETDARRTAILDTATRMFAQHGFEGVRLQDVGAELGLSKAALYRWFDSKEALFVECIDRIRYLVVPRAARSAGAVADLQQRGAIRTRAVLESFESYRMLTQLLVTVASGRDRELARKARDAYHRMVTNVVPDLELAVRAGIYRKGDLQLDAYMLWGALMGAGDFMRFVRGDEIDALVRAFMELFAFGTTPASARNPRRPVRRPRRKR